MHQLFHEDSEPYLAYICRLHPWTPLLGVPMTVQRHVHENRQGQSLPVLLHKCHGPGSYCPFTPGTYGLGTGQCTSITSITQDKNLLTYHPYFVHLAKMNYLLSLHGHRPSLITDGRMLESQAHASRHCKTEAAGVGTLTSQAARKWWTNQPNCQH